MNENKPHGLVGNKNAAKPPDQKAESFIHARCKTSEKSAWVKAAQAKGMKLTDWIIETLNSAINSKEK